MRKLLLRRFAALTTVFGLVFVSMGLTAAPASAKAFRVKLAVSATNPKVGDTIKLTGRVYPKPSQRKVYLQVQDAGSTTWRLVRRVTTAKSGQFQVAVPITEVADRAYRIYKPKQGSRRAASSKAVQITVSPAVADSTALSVSPQSGALVGGTVVTISGSGLSSASKVTFTPQVSAADTADGSGLLPDLEAGLEVVDDNTLKVTTPPALGGTSIVSVHTPSGVLTTSYTYRASDRSASDFEEELLKEINVQRAEARVCHEDGANNSMPAAGPVSWDAELADVAASHALDLVDRQGVYNGISHVTYKTASFRTRFRKADVTSSYGEIIALSPKAYRTDQIVRQWLNSTTGHCEVLMDARWTKAGAGVFEGTWQTPIGVQASLFSNMDFR